MWEFNGSAVRIGVRAAIGLASSLVITSSVLAQEAAPEQQTESGGAAKAPLEEVLVTGYRLSVRSALSEKRLTPEQIDMIKAEDIALFPESNLAESLQRLPGVSIDRDNGEGRSITVRGLGGDFNRTRINGLEALSTAGSNDAGSHPNRSRSFDYNTFASELFSSLKVQKSASAKTDEGSLGATIDLTTARPFDFAESMKFAGGAQGVWQDHGGDIDPRVSGLFSTKFADDTMGFLISAAYQQTKTQKDQYRRLVGSSDYLYRGSDLGRNSDNTVAEWPARGGFAAPAGTAFVNQSGSPVITNPEAIALLTGSNPDAYAALYPDGFHTDGRFDDSLVRIPALLSLEQRDVENDRLGLSAAYQWQIRPGTRLSADGLYSRFHNVSTNYQIQSVGLNRNNSNSAGAVRFLNGPTGTDGQKRGAYPGLCTFAEGSDFTPAQDCGQAMNGGELAPGYQFSYNPNNLDPWDYYNNPNSVGYTGAANGWGGFAPLIGRPAVRVIDANVTNGFADYLALQNVDWRSGADRGEYTTEFGQGSLQLDHEFTDTLRGSFVYGQSESTNDSQGLLVEFNHMDEQGLFVYDERNANGMPSIDFGFNAADPNNWSMVKGFSGIRHFRRAVENTYEGLKADFEWDLSDELRLSFGATGRKFGFETKLWQRNTDTLNPTEREAGVTAADLGRVISFGQGIDLPAGTATSFYAPSIEAFDQLFGFTCDCINEWGDWRITDKRNGGRDNFQVEEDNLGGYLQLDFTTELFGRTFFGNVGARLVETELTSRGTTAGGNGTTGGREVVGRNSYTDVLPAMNLNYELTPDFLFRLGVSKVMSRPLLGNLAPTMTSLSIPSAGDVGSVTLGNPQLDPFRSTNFDASLEWYFDEGALVSIGGFYKDIDTFPQTVIYETTIGELFDDGVLAALREQYANDLNRLPYLEDPNSTIRARQFRDAPGGWIKGFEITYQQEFRFLPGWLADFGLQANYTNIKSELEYILDPGNGTTIAPTTAAGPWLNVSPEAINATLYYERERFMTRVSVSKRTGFASTYPLSSGSCSPGITDVRSNGQGNLCNGPLINDFEYRRGTTNVDMAVSYKLTDYLTVRLDGLNLTDELDERYAYQGQGGVSLYAATGRVFRFGMRANF